MNIYSVCYLVHESRENSEYFIHTSVRERGIFLNNIALCFGNMEFAHYTVLLLLFITDLFSYKEASFNK